MSEQSNSEETHATDLSATFYTHFQTKKNDIISRLEALNTSDSSEIPSTALISVSSEIVTLRKDLVDATPYLPSYDRGKCEQQIKVLEESLSRHRAPKSKFAFKRKPANTSSHVPLHTPKKVSKDLSPTQSSGPSTVHSTTNLTLSSRSVTRLTLSSLVRPADVSSSQLKPDDLPRSSDITLTGLHECIVNLFPSMAPKDALNIPKPTLTITALHARALQSVLLVMPPIEGSVLLHDIHNSIIIVGCHQFRMHDSTNTTVLLHVLSNPIIERSQSIQFGAYPDALHHAFSKSFSERSSNHTMVQDFDWIKSSPSPNWRLLNSSPSFVEQLLQVANDEVGDNDVEQVLGKVLQRE